VSDELNVRTIFTQDLLEITLQSDENLDALLDLIKDKVNDGKNIRTHIFSMLCELVWLNSYILLILRKDLQDITFKDEEKKEVIVSEVTLDTLLSLVVARSQAIDELNGFSYSLSLH
tara:strand:- start:525 stop:875 length:351 start_codon:yes stop_codon:yes gene_type:complete